VLYPAGGASEFSVTLEWESSSLVYVYSAKIWQYADSGPYPGDQDLFNGTLADLKLWVTLLPLHAGIQANRGVIQYGHHVCSVNMAELRLDSRM
jgi:hypothetical protein